MAEWLALTLVVVALLGAAGRGLESAGPRLARAYRGALEARLEAMAYGRPAAPLLLPRAEDPRAPPPAADYRISAPPAASLPPGEADVEALQPPNLNLVIVVCGYRSPAECADLQGSLLALGYAPEDVIVFSYRDFAYDPASGEWTRPAYSPRETATDLLVHALRLGAAVRAYHAHTGRQVDIVAHSQGGVVALAAVALDPDPWHPGFDHIVTVDSPLQGMPELSASAGLLGSLGQRSLVQLGSESSLMAELRRAAAAGQLGRGLSLTTVSGVNDQIVSSSHSWLPPAWSDDPQMVRNHLLVGGLVHSLSGKVDPFAHGTNVDSPAGRQIIRQALSDEEVLPPGLPSRAWHAANRLADLLPLPRPFSVVSLLRLSVGGLVSWFALRQLLRQSGIAGPDAEQRGGGQGQQRR